jgi:hypothetical protein
MSRPSSFPNRPPGPTWTSQQPTRSGQSRPQRPFPPSMRAFASPHRVEIGEEGVARFSPLQCEVVHSRPETPRAQTTARCAHTPAATHHGVTQIVNGSLTIRWQPRVRVVTYRARSRSSLPTRESSPSGGDQQPATPQPASRLVRAAMDAGDRLGGRDGSS